jgi:hypothetical protein
MFDRSGEMRLSSLGLLLILAACVMTLFIQPSPQYQVDPQTIGAFFGRSE